MNNFLRSCGLTLALCAMLVRALLPAGWMPGPVGAGHTAFVICTAQGFARLPSAPAPDRDHLIDHGGQACPFGAAVAFSPPDVTSLLPALAWNVWRLSPPATPPLVVVQPPDGVHPPRAPPILV
jgi:hypothetical protein